MAWGCTLQILKTNYYAYIIKAALTENRDVRYIGSQT